MIVPRRAGSVQAPERLSAREAAKLSRRAAFTGRPFKQSEARAFARELRLRQARPVVHGIHVAAWLLVCPPHRVRDLIASGALRGRGVAQPDGRASLEFRADDLRRIAAMVDRQEDDR